MTLEEGIAMEMDLMADGDIFLAEEEAARAMHGSM